MMGSPRVRGKGGLRNIKEVQLMGHGNLSICENGPEQAVETRYYDECWALSYQKGDAILDRNKEHRSSRLER